MLPASRSFNKKANRGAVDPIGLLTILGQGQSSEVTSEADWGVGITNLFRPTNHYDLANSTINEVDAYDGDTADASTTDTISPASGDLFFIGRNAANDDQWDVPAGLECHSAIAKIVAQRTAGDSRIQIALANSIGTNLGYFFPLSPSTGAIAKATFSLIIPAAYLNDLSDLRIVVFTSESDTSTVLIYDTWIETSSGNIDYDATYKWLTEALVYGWTASGSGTNEFYCRDLPSGDPSLPPQNILIMDNVWLTKGTLGSLADHEFGYGDNDALGFNTIYVRDDTGTPFTSGVKIEIMGKPPDSGDVILAADNSVTSFGDKITATSDLLNEMDAGGWEDVDDLTPGDADYFYHNTAEGGGVTPQWTGDVSARILASVPANAQPIKVRMTLRTKTVSSLAGNMTHRAILRYDGVDDIHVTGYSNTQSWVTWTREWTETPAGAPWTRDNIALITGIGVDVSTGFGNKEIYCSMLYIEVLYYNFETSGNIISRFDLGATANVNNKALVSIDDYIPTGTSIIYTIKGSATGAFTGEEVDLGAIVDGSSIEGYRHYEITALFTGTGLLTPVLQRFRIDVPDTVYKFSMGLLSNVPGSLPYLNNIPGRNLKVNLTRFISATSNMAMPLQNVEAVRKMLRQEPMKGRHAIVNVGLGESSQEKDLIDYYQGQVIDFKISEKIITVSLKDPTKNLDNKIPQPPVGAGAVSSIAITYDGTHMVDVLLDILSRAEITGRWVDKASFEVVRENIGNGTPAPSNYIVKRTGTNIIDKPTKARDLIEELLEIMGCYLIVQENGKLQLVEYDSTAAAVDTWLDTDLIKPIYRPKLESSLFNVCAVFYDDDGDENYTNVYGDFDLVSTGNYGTFIKTIKTPWLGGSAADGYYGEEIAGATAIREVVRLANGQGVFITDTNLSKYKYQQGQYIDIISSEISRYAERDDVTRKFIIVGKGWKFNMATIKWTLAEVR